MDAVRRTACGDRVWEVGVERAAASALARPGCAGLTARELEVLTLKRHRHTNAEIAGRLDISVHTVKHHVSSINGKLATWRDASRPRRE